MHTTIKERIPAGFCGTLKIIQDLPKIEAHCIIDSHMHIQSNKCAPKPLQDNQLKRMDLKEKVAHLVPIIIWAASGPGGGLFLGSKSEIKIGNTAIRECCKTYGHTAESTAFGNCRQPHLTARLSAIDGSPKRVERVFTIMVSHMMDMEYAHIAGYEGKKIYHAENGDFFYYKRESGILAENQGERISDKRGAAKLKTWIKQYNDTCVALLENPWNLLGMLKYEPRRWRFKKGVKPDEQKNFGGWDFPFSDIATAQNVGLFIGFKMYPPLGFQPLDPNLPYLWKYATDKSDCFYGVCEDQDIPILTHCSPGGMITHEIMYYREFFTRTPNRFQVSKPAPSNETTVIQHSNYNQPTDQVADAETWFYNNHVHPSAWRKVLEKFPSLKLCLAHFGGDLWQSNGPQDGWIQEIISLITEKNAHDEYTYENLYTDIACWDITIPAVREALKSIIQKTPELKKRLLFGSDWHMILIVAPYCDYKVYCENWKKFLDEIDEKLWIRFSLVNPFDFFGLTNETKLQHIYEGLKKTMGKFSVQVEKGFQKILEIRNEVEHLKKALELWDAEGC